MLNTIIGQDGKHWVYDEHEVAHAQRGRPFTGWEEGNEEHRVRIQRVLGGNTEDDFEEDRRHLRRAFEVGQLPEICSCPFIRQVLDLAEPFSTFLIQELADADLEVIVKAGPLPPEERRQLHRSLTEALRAIHTAGLAHSDVQTSNVLRVGDVWKLADLGAAVALGGAIDCLPKDHRFVLPSIDQEPTASVEMDWWGAAEVLRDAGAGEDELNGDLATP